VEGTNLMYAQRGDGGCNERCDERDPWHGCNKDSTSVTRCTYSIKMRRAWHVAWWLLRGDTRDTWHGCNKDATSVTRGMVATKRRCTGHVARMQ
jgi:hypothetical protein